MPLAADLTRYRMSGSTWHRLTRRIKLAVRLLDKVQTQRALPHTSLTESRSSAVESWASFTSLAFFATHPPQQLEESYTHSM
mmetsp:Transcript_7842/g.17222  ORF Transcript_7842/g.17222 Transcript_7842/m.17222 type:complete len:82 (+) Transcript_7842:626-871(+)